jgi:hypothetical protein
MAERSTLKRRCCRVDLPEEFIDLAQRRTAFLFRLVRQQDLTVLFASAYLQGVRDAAETIERNEWPSHH